MSIFDKGIILEQHKEPMLSRKTFVMKHEDETFESPFGDIPADQMTRDEVVIAARLAGIVDESSGRMLCDEMEQVPEKSTLIIDAIDDEPYISSQMAHILHNGDELADGARIFAAATGAEKIRIYIYENIFDLTTPFPRKLSGIEIKKLGGRYPAESRAYAKLYRKKENVVIGSGALIHLSRAVRNHVKQTTAFVTVAGDVLESPRNVEAVIGTTAAELLDMCKTVTDPEIVVIGGSMTGRSTFEPENEHITATTGGVLAFRKSFRNYTYRCMGCGRCDNACPKGLTPSAIRKIDEFERHDLIGRYDTEHCIECGACSYACPARLDVMGAVIRAKKTAIAKKEVAEK